MKTAITTSIIGLTLAAMTASAATLPTGSVNFQNKTKVQFDVSMPDYPKAPTVPIQSGNTTTISNFFIHLLCVKEAKDCKFAFINHSSGKEVYRVAIDTTGTAPYHIIDHKSETTKYKVNYDNPVTKVTISNN